MKTVGVILIFTAFLGMALFCFQGLATLIFVSKSGSGLPFRHCAAPGRALRHYRQWCEGLEIQPDQGQLQRYNIAARILGSAVLAMVVGLGLIIITLEPV
ncbi:hypothetical protein BST95_07720 [Halioglobus japonicus]|uniref:Uncharacterized protein n=1 Tax=Halioglobus japonicus TaxID=930805 RepID=A0AAP8ME30_9GAMM|nr:hypothetical protein BST95_07720 [Halioglobus japonicus]PLW86140.1 hypothetical protein C0029_06760 [Halioglobus japonicus]